MQCCSSFRASYPSQRCARLAIEGCSHGGRLLFEHALKSACFQCIFCLTRCAVSAICEALFFTLQLCFVEADMYPLCS